MAVRKKKKRKKTQRSKKKLSLAKLNVEQLRHNGAHLFELGNYAESIRYLKELCKREPGEESTLLLSRSYQKQVEALQGKGMAIEAIAMLNSMKQQCGISGSPRQQVVLLCQCRKYEKAVTVYHQHLDGFSKNEQAEIEEFFGAAALAGNKLLDMLPENMTVRAQYPQAENVLLAYCRGDSATTAEELKKITFRSPYRHFRLLISGLLHLENDPLKAENILAKLPVTSPFYGLIDVFSIRIMGTKEKLEQLEKAKSMGKLTQVQSVLGLNDKQGRFLLKLADAGPNENKVLRLLLAYAAYLPKRSVQQMGRRLLSHCSAPDPSFAKVVQGWSEAELLSSEALMSEIHHMPSDAVIVWDEYLEKLPRDTPDYNLRRALVLRKQAELSVGLIYHELYNPDGGLHRLLESVELDPDDRKSWLRIIELSQTEKSAAESYRIVNRAIEQFPNDIDILLKVIEVTAGRGAYKKASRFAARLLEIDPINVRGKQLLAEAHLSHGHKLCKQKKYELAEKEFGAVEAESRNHSLAGRSYICLAMVAFLQKDRNKSRELLEESRTLCASPLMRAFLPALESRLCRLPKTLVREFDKELRGACKADIDREECCYLVGWQQKNNSDESQGLAECFRVMKNYFSRAADLSWSRDEAKVVAEAMLAASLYPQLGKIVSNRLKAEFNDHYFKFMEIVAASRNGQKPLARETKEVLWSYKSEAWFRGDQVLADRIESFCRKCTLDNEDEDYFEDDDLIDDEIFKMLIKMSESAESGQGNPQKNSPSRSRQLGLFDDIFGED